MIMPPQYTEMRYSILRLIKKGLQLRKERRRFFGIHKTTPRKELEREAVKNRSAHCGLWDVDAYDLSVSRRCRAEVRHVKFPSRAKGYGRRNDGRPNPPSYCGVLPNRVQHLPWSMKILPEELHRQHIRVNGLRGIISALARRISGILMRWRRRSRSSFCLHTVCWDGRPQGRPSPDWEHLLHLNRSEYSGMSRGVRNIGVAHRTYSVRVMGADVAT